MVPWVGLRCVIVVFPDHLFITNVFASPNKIAIKAVDKKYI